MRVRFARTGGVAGATLKCDLSTEALPPGEGQRLADLVRDSRFFDLPAVLQADGAGADRFQYDITVEQEGTAHTVRLSETGMPPSLRPLVAWLVAASRRPGA